MSQIALCIVLLLMVHSAITATVKLVSVPGYGKTGTCPLRGKNNKAIQHIRTSVLEKTLNLTIFIHNCGSGEWYRVAHLNMSNSSQQCPSAWREYNNVTDGVRGCRRPETSSGSCLATFYSTNRQYSRVCGRIVGYQIGSTDAFGYKAVGGTINSYYVYGVSVTHGVPRNHIWTLASGLSERAHTPQGWTCPCVDPSVPGNAFPPSFVGNNYYCESGNPTSTWISGHLYSSDPLWDGQQCEGQCCSNGKSPPWFSVELPNPTTDDIEVRICSAQGSFDDVAIQLLELYVQ